MYLFLGVGYQVLVYQQKEAIELFLESVFFFLILYKM